MHVFDVGTGLNLSKKSISEPSLFINSHNLGPMPSGAFVYSSATWGWSFYITLCAGAVAAPALIFLLPSHHPQLELMHHWRVASIDWVGVILSLGPRLFAFVAMSFGGPSL